MRLDRNIGVAAGSLLVVSLVFADTNYVDEAMKLSREEEKIEYVRSLDQEAVWVMASQAYEKEWSDYAVAAGIIDPYFGSRWAVNPPSEQDLLCVITNSSLHPRLRSGLAASGMRYADRWEFKAFLHYVDAVLSVLEDQDSTSLPVEKIPEQMHRYLKSKMDSLRQGGEFPPDKRSQADAILRRVTRIADYLTSIINDGRGKSEDPTYVLSYACGHLGEYVGWCLEAPLPATEEARRTVRAAKKGQEALVRVLVDEEYAPDVARVVLRCSEKSKLDEVLPEDVVINLKVDKRFSGHEYQRLLDRLSQRIKSKQK